MANNPSTLPGYNGQTAAPDANYTYGSARNDTAPGDLTGTPRIAEEINDLMGDQQSLLVSAGIVPSGSPDKVGESQYLQARWVIHGATKPTVADMVAEPQLLPGMKVTTTDFKTSPRGGGGVYLIKTAAQAATDGDVIDEKINHTLTTTDVAILQNLASIQADQSGAEGDGSNDDTDSIKASIETEKEAVFDLSKSYKMTSISLNDSVHLFSANLNFSGTDAGFDVDTAITGLSMVQCKLTGDSNLASSQKGISSNEPITKGYFLGNQLFGFQQGFDLNSAVQTVLSCNWIEESVGTAAGEGYGVIAGSSQRGAFTSNIIEKCQRHGLYLNNALYSTVGSNVFYKHRDGQGAGGSLGALQFNGQAKGVATVGNSFSLSEGPDCVLSPNDENTSPQEGMLIAANTFYNGQSANLRVGNSTPGVNKKVKGAFLTANMFHPVQDTDLGIVRILSGDNINISNNSWHLEGGTGGSPYAVLLGETTPDDAFFENITVCNNTGVFTGNGGQASFLRVCEELCLGTTRIDIFNNNVETDLLINYAVRPTNPNIRTDDQKVLSVTLVAGAQDFNVAGYNIFSVTGDVAGSSIDNFTNGYKNKVIEIRINDVNVVSMNSTGNKSLGGAFASTNKDIIIFKYDGATWREHTRSLNT